MSRDDGYSVLQHDEGSGIDVTRNKLVNNLRNSMIEQVGVEQAVTEISDNELVNNFGTTARFRIETEIGGESLVLGWRRDGARR